MSSDDKILNDTIKIIYNNDNGATIKNAIMATKECSPQYSQLLTKNNKTVKNSNRNSKRNSNRNNNRNSNKSKKPIISDVFKDNCLIKKKKIKNQPQIIISEDKEDDKNTKFSYLIFIISDVLLSFNKYDKTNQTNTKQKYINWIAIIDDDNKVDENIIEYSLNKEKGLHDFTIRIYKFKKDNKEIIDKIKQIINNQINIIKKLNNVDNLKKIYKNNFVVLNEEKSFFNWKNLIIFI